MKEIKFTSYPLVAYPLRGFFSVFIIVLVTVLSYVFVQHIVMPIFAFLIISMPLVNFLFPSSYTFNDDYFKKIQLFQERKIEWDVFNHYSVMNDGILLICNVNRRRNEYVYIFDGRYTSQIEELLNKVGVTKYARGEERDA